MASIFASSRISPMLGMGLEMGKRRSPLKRKAPLFFTSGTGRSGRNSQYRLSSHNREREEMDLSLVPDFQSPKTERCAPAAARYRECLRNHAAAMGGQAYDGCGEFMASEEEPLKCAACGCHRNFHRQVGLPGHQLLGLNIAKHTMVSSPIQVSFFPPRPLPFYRIPPAKTARGGSETLSRGEEGMMRKRYRTKFTAEQKEKMRIFAEKLGWRIKKHDDDALEEFCVEIGVKRHVLKIWMHNHKNNPSSSSVSADRSAVTSSETPTIRV